MKDSSLPRMMTVKEVAKTKLLPEHAIRVMLKKGQIPAVYCGNKALINFDLLVEQLMSPDTYSEGRKIK